MIVMMVKAMLVLMAMMLFKMFAAASPEEWRQKQMCAPHLGAEN